MKQHVKCGPCVPQSKPCMCLVGSTYNMSHASTSAVSANLLFFKQTSVCLIYCHHRMSSQTQYLGGSIYIVTLRQLTSSTWEPWRHSPLVFDTNLNLRYISLYAYISNYDCWWKYRKDVYRKESTKQWCYLFLIVLETKKKALATICWPVTRELPLFWTCTLAQQAYLMNSLDPIQITSSKSDRQPISVNDSHNFPFFMHS